MKDLSAVTADHVGAAVRLFDDLGEQDFLTRYRFGPSTTYRLRVGGASYPSKAILGVAHEFATGTALRSTEFTGGLQETVKVLEHLGFEISSAGPATQLDREARSRATYLLLWNPKAFRWSDVERLGILDATLDGEGVESRWSIYANRKQVRAGDRVFLRKTGQQSPGVIASGWVRSEVYTAEHWDPSRPGDTYFVDVEWDAMVDSEDTLELSALAEEFPHSAWAAYGGGAVIPQEIAVELEREWALHLDAEVTPHGAGGGGTETYRESITRAYAEALVRHRRHQRAFRELLLQVRGHRCAYEKCDVDDPKILEAAHIIPDSEGGEPSLENGLLLCRNHHRAFDIAMLGYDGERFHWSPGVKPF